MWKFIYKRRVLCCCMELVGVLVLAQSPELKHRENNRNRNWTILANFIPYLFSESGALSLSDCQTCISGDVMFMWSSPIYWICYSLCIHREHWYGVTLAALMLSAVECILFNLVSSQLVFWLLICKFRSCNKQG